MTMWMCNSYISLCTSIIKVLWPWNIFVTIRFGLNYVIAGVVLDGHIFEKMKIEKCLLCVASD